MFQINHNAFKSLMQFLYTGRLETNINDVDIVLRLANQCELPKLKTELEDQLKKLTAFGKQLFFKFQSQSSQDSLVDGVRL